MARWLPTAGAALVVLGAGTAFAGDAPSLTASGPVRVSGTEASAVFTVADRTVRQVRYADQGTLRYTFRLTNEGVLPVTVTGLAGQADPRLFDLVGIGHRTLGAGDTGEVTVTLRMTGCQTLSSRSGSFVGELALATERVGVPHEVVVPLPEELHTGSPREVSCPGASATSRPQG